MKLLFKTEDYLDDDFIVSSKRNMESLAESIKCKRATLFLGAGVSVNVGLPTWPELLSELYLNLALLFSKEKENPIFNNMVNNNHKVFENINAIEAGEYIHTILESRAFHSLPWSEPEANINGKVSKVQMVSIMRDVLTRRFKEKEKVGYDAERWSILDAICDFTSGMNGIRNIVTYNFDDCLEYALLNRCNKKDVLSHGMMAVPTLNS
ncbi:MAG: hypothetical protein LBR68_02495, partial [Lachnoclostridium sp.]|nr:hypothetical protein [Lachnoclostridium sp.]